MKVTKRHKNILFFGTFLLLLYCLYNGMFSHREGMKSQKSHNSPIEDDMSKLNKDYKHAMDLLADGDVDKNALEHSMNLLTRRFQKIIR